MQQNTWILHQTGGLRTINSKSSHQVLLPNMFRSGMSYKKALSFQSLLGFETVDKETVDPCSACECINLSVERARHTPFLLHIGGCEGKASETEIRGGAVPNLGSEITESREKAINEARSQSRSQPHQLLEYLHVESCQRSLNHPFVPHTHAHTCAHSSGPGAC